LAIHVLRHLGSSVNFGSMYLVGGVQTHGNRLAQMITRSTESLVVRSGFIWRLEATSSVPQEPLQILRRVDNLIKGESIEDEDVEYIDWLTHAAVLDLLVEQTRPELSGPTLAHFLLGYADNERILERLPSPRDPNTARTCLHSILEQLTDGLPRAENLEEEDTFSDLLVEVDPYIALHSVMVIHQLAVHPLTSVPTLKYLRNQEDFVHRALRVLQPQPPAAEGGGTKNIGSVQYADGLSIPTTASALILSLRYYGTVLQLAALEVHTIKPRSKDASHIVRAFLESSISGADEEGSRVASVDQSIPLAVECLLRCRLRFQDPRDLQLQPQYFGQIDWAAHRRPNEDGIVLFDVQALQQTLLAEEDKFLMSGPLSAERVAELQLERQQILLAIAAKNDATLIAASSVSFLNGWAQLLDVILHKTFDNVPTNTRQSLLFDLLRISCQLLRDGAEEAVTFQRTLGQEVLSLVTVLNEDLASLAWSGSAPPTEQLLELFQDVVLSATAQGDELARGYLHVSLIKLVHLSVSTGQLSPVSAGYSAFATLRSGMVALLDTDGQRMLAALCRDAFGGFEVWKTVSYTLLNSLILLTKGSSDQKLVSRLSSDGFLGTIVRSIPVNDSDLRAALQMDPGKSLPRCHPTASYTDISLLCRGPRPDLRVGGQVFSFAGCRTNQVRCGEIGE
jgi:nuclear pore complex protein Nup205